MFEDAVEPALPGHLHRPLEGVTPQAAQGWALQLAQPVKTDANTALSTLPPHSVVPTTFP